MQGRPSLVLLGPQRFQPTLRQTLHELGVEGPVAVITAGWQEREGETRELSEHVGRETRNRADPDDQSPDAVLDLQVQWGRRVEPR